MSAGGVDSPSDAKEHTSSPPSDTPVLELVAAIDEERGIGRGGDLPWRISADMAHFKRLTTEAPEGLQNVVIMGRRTWESIPERFRPLRDRLNVVLSSNLTIIDGHTIVSKSFTEALDAVPEVGIHRVFVIGGASVYAAALEHTETRFLHLTRVKGSHDCDVFFPSFNGFTIQSISAEFEEGDERFRFEVWERQ